MSISPNIIKYIKIYAPYFHTMKRKSILYITVITIIILILLLIYYFLPWKKKTLVVNTTQDEKITDDVKDKITDDEKYDENEEWYFSNFYKDGTLLAEWISSWEFYKFIVYSKDGEIIWTWDGKIMEDCDINGCTKYSMVHNWTNVRFYDDDSIQSISKNKNGLPLHITYYSRDWTFIWELEYKKGHPYSWTEFYFFDNWQIEAETHYKKWIMDGPHYVYYKSWALMIDAFLINWRSLRRDTYDENWNKIDRIY